MPETRIKNGVREVFDELNKKFVPSSNQENLTADPVNPTGKKFPVSELLNETTPLTEEQKKQASLDADTALANKAKPVKPITETPVEESPLAPERMDENGPIDLNSLEPSTDGNVIAARERIRQDQAAGLVTPQEVLDFAELEEPEETEETTVKGEDALEEEVELTPEQELNIAAQREINGIASQTDIDNLDYAEQHLGYERPGEGEMGVDPATRTAVDNVEGAIGSVPDSSQSPTKTYADTYQQIYTDLGLTDVKTQISESTNAISDMEDKKDEEIRDINDNPWLTEGVRLRSIKKVEEKYQDKLGNLYSKLNLEQSMFNSGVEQAQFIASQALSLNQWQQEFDFKTKESLAKQAQDAADALFSSTQFRSVGGGIYDLKNKKWIVNPTPKGGGGGGENDDDDFTPEETAFEKDLNAEVKKLQRGGSWADSWNFLHNRYPEATNEQLDLMLDKAKYFSQA